MRRRLLNFLTALSLLVCVAVAALWVRSYFVADWVRWSAVDYAAPEVHYRTVQSDSGGIFVLDRRDRWANFAQCVEYYRCLERYLREQPGRMRREMAERGATSAYPRPVRMLGWTGFRHDHSARFDRFGGLTEWSAVVPYWSVGLAFLLLPAARLTFALRRRRRRVLGLCPRCGYDLRGTPELCPECGTSGRITPA
jgi:hypothetical protein